MKVEVSVLLGAEEMEPKIPPVSFEDELARADPNVEGCVAGAACPNALELLNADAPVPLAAGCPNALVDPNAEEVAAGG